jgi:hypothetical protein
MPPLLLYAQWREAECFLHSPFSFSRLKQLPELRQIISHTCLDVVHAAAGRSSCIAAAAGPQPQQDQPQQQQQQGDGITHSSSKQRRRQRSKAKSKQRSWDAMDDLDVDWPDFDSGFDSDDSSNDNYEHRLQKLLQDSDTPLLLHLAPGLRLCLAAEVAVGMLCTG